MAAFLPPDSTPMGRNTQDWEETMLSLPALQLWGGSHDGSQPACPWCSEVYRGDLSE